MEYMTIDTSFLFTPIYSLGNAIGKMVATVILSIYEILPYYPTVTLTVGN